MLPGKQGKLRGVLAPYFKHGTPCVFKHTDQKPGLLLLQRGREGDFQAQRTSSPRPGILIRHPPALPTIQRYRIDGKGSGVFQQVGRTVRLQGVREDPTSRGRRREVVLLWCIEKPSDPTTTTTTY